MRSALLLAFGTFCCLGCTRSTPTEAVVARQSLAGTYDATYSTCTPTTATVELREQGSDLVATLPSFGTLVLSASALTPYLHGKIGAEPVGSLLFDPVRCGYQATEIYFDHGYSDPSRTPGSFQVYKLLGRGVCRECDPTGTVMGTESAFVSLRPRG